MIQELDRTVPQLAASCATLADPGATVRSRRAALRLLLGAVAPPPPANLDDLLRAEDPGIRALAAALAGRVPPPAGSSAAESAGGLGDCLREAGPTQLRLILDQCRPPLPAALADAVADVWGGGDLDRALLAPGLAAALPPPAAEELLLRFLAAGPHRAAARVAVLAALARVATAAAGGALAERLADPDPQVAAAAAAAYDALRGRLLAAGEIELAVQLVREARRHAPQDRAHALDEALIAGVYLGDTGATLAHLERLLARHALVETGAGAIAPAELLLARGVILYFDGQAAAAEQALDHALRLLGEVGAHQDEAALLRARLHLVAAILAVAAGAEDVRDRLRVAVRDTPYDREVARVDEALGGRFGPLIVLEHLRRTGHEEARLRFWRALDETLADAGGNVLGIPLDGAGPEPGTDAAALEGEQVKSWAPCRRAWALYEAGRLDEAEAVAERVGRHLVGTHVWNNRLLAAEANLVLGHVRARGLRAGAAAEAYRDALVAFEEVGEETLRQQGDVLEGMPRPGEAPLQDPHAQRRALALLGLADVAGVLDGDLARARTLVEGAARTAPDEPLVQVHLARVRVHDDPDRAVRVLAGMPRTAGLLLALSRLAAALGHAAEAERLFLTHLAWNTLTPERRALEEAWHARAAAQQPPAPR